MYLSCSYTHMVYESTLDYYNSLKQLLQGLELYLGQSMLLKLDICLLLYKLLFIYIKFVGGV